METAGGNRNGEKNGAKRILLLDDEPGVVFALKLLLETLGYRVNEFTAAAEAISLLQAEGDFSLFLCDLKMPGMSGLTVLAESQKVRPGLPFVLMSGHATGDEIAKAKALGARGFLAKPFTPQELKNLVAELR